MLVSRDPGLTLRWCQVSVLLFTLCVGQKLPTRDEDKFRFQISNAEIFYDTKSLPDGAEVTSYIFKEREQRYFFIVEEDDTPVSISLTPCSSTLTWTLYITDMPEERSGHGLDSSVDSLRGQESHSYQTPSPVGTMVKKMTSNRQMTFQTDNSPSGVYIMEVTPTERDTSLKMYATTTPASDHAYPELLANHDQVRIVSEERDTVHFSWEPSQSESSYGQNIEYCLTVSQVGNFPTLCAAHAYMHGDIPPTAPPNSGFGFTWEKDMATALKSKAELATPAPDYVYYTCVGSKTTYAYSELEPGETYYIDVFAVNKDTNRSTAYHGVKIKTKPRPPKITPLKDGKMVMEFLKRSKRSKLYKYHLSRDRKELLLSIQPCAGFLDVEIIKDNQVLKQLTVASLRKITLANAGAGTYFVKISHVDRKRSTSYKIMVTRKPSKYPYPKLPENTQIKVFPNLITCNSVTLAWLGTNIRSKYCLYKREEKTSTYRLFPILPQQCSGPEVRKKTDKVMCRHFRYKNRRRAVMTATVHDLKPNTLYRFDVYITKRGGESLAFKTTFTTTKGC